MIGLRTLSERRYRRDKILFTYTIPTTIASPKSFHLLPYVCIINKGLIKWDSPVKI